MTTQRDRLAAVLHECADSWDTCEWSWCPNGEAVPGRHDEMADALLARGVRVVDAETLGVALQDHVCEQEPSDWGAFDKCGVECSSAVLEALDDEP